MLLSFPFLWAHSNNPGHTRLLQPLFLIALMLCTFRNQTPLLLFQKSSRLLSSRFLTEPPKHQLPSLPGEWGATQSRHALPFHTSPPFPPLFAKLKTAFLA